MRNFIIIVVLFVCFIIYKAYASFESMQTGWISYADTTYTVSNPFTIANGTTDTLENNAQTLIVTQKPNSVTNWYNSSTKKITPSLTGDFYNIIIRFKAKTTANNDYMDVSCDIGGTQGIIYEKTLTMVKGANTEHFYTLEMNVYTASTFVSNGGTIKVTANTGTLSIYNISYVIARLHRAKL